MKILSFLDWFTLGLGGKGGGGSNASYDASIAQQKADEDAKAALRQRVDALYGGPEAQAQFATEEGNLRSALTSQYGIDQEKAAREAERQLRFGAAQTGNIGGSTYATGQSKLEEANRTVGTNIAQAVDRSINDLRAQREQSRAQALAAVNAGTGEAAVTAAQSGIQGAINAAKAAQRENVVGDAFGAIGLSKTTADQAARDRKSLALAQGRLSSLTPAGTDSSGGRRFN